MPTQIIDGFKLNATTPIDSRMVTSGTVSRNNLAYKYDGLRVFDTVQKIPFVYIDGQWKQELEQTQAAGGGGAISASGKKNYFAKFDTNGLTNSVVREATGGANTFVGINIPINSPIQNQLHVGGVVQASSFCGNILGTFVNVGTLPLNRLVPPAIAGNYMLKYQGNQAVWGTMDATATATTIENNTDSTSTFVTFVSGTTGTQTLNVSCSNQNTAMTANLATSQLLMSNTNGQSTPPYSFIGASDTGLYGSTAEVGISMAGNKRISATSNKLEISTGGSVNIDAGANYVQVYKNATFNGTVNISGITTVSNKLIANSFQIPTTNGAGKILLSDATGNATWASAVALGTPIGTIVMFIMGLGKIPAGWKPCIFFSDFAGTINGTDYKGELFINGSYEPVPNTSDRNIMGSCNYTSLNIYGTKSPTVEQKTTLSATNLPNHKHGISTNAYVSQTVGASDHCVKATSTFSGTAESHDHTVASYDGRTENNDGAGDKTDVARPGGSRTSSSCTLTPKGSVTTTLSGWTDDLTAWYGAGAVGKPFNNPFYRAQEMIFIIKIDPNAAPNTEGHYRVEPV